MVNKIYTAWIDDKFVDVNDARTTQAKAIEQAGGNDLRLELVASTDHDFSLWIEKFKDNSQQKPDIVILDFKLDKSPLFVNSVSLKDGYELGKMLELTPLRFVPKYLVSAVFEEKHTAPNIEGFDWILGNPVDSELISQQILSDGNSYRCINSVVEKQLCDPERATETLVEAMAVPCGSQSDTKDLSIKALKHAEHLAEDKGFRDIDNNGTGIEIRALTFSKWLRGTFLLRIGPLLDAHSAANLVGADQEYYSNTLVTEFSQQRPSAIYQGIFENNHFPRWWRTEVIDWILETFDDISLGPISQMAPKVAEHLKIPEGDLARCAVCGELWPDVVAFDAEEREVLRQVHRYCSDAIEDQAILPGFEEIRSFQQS